MARRTSRLVGRAPELNVLLDAFESCEATGGLVLVSGEAGVGKSRLISALGERADDALVVTGACVDTMGADIPYAPWTEVLWWLVREVGDDLDDRLKVELARLLPELGPVVNDVEDEGKGRLFDAVVRLIGHVGGSRRLVVVIEDIHWIDAASRELLQYVAQQVRRTAALFVVTLRPDERVDELRTLIAHLTRVAVERIDLNPLDLESVVEMVALLSGNDVGTAELQTIIRKADGNPLLIEELVNARGEALPASVRDLLLARFSALGPDARQLVRTASVIGARSPRGWLVEASGLGDDGARAAAREAVVSGVLLIDDDGQGYEFRHALLRDAVLADLIPDERVAIHGALARSLEAHPQWSAHVDRATELARHWDAVEEPAAALRWSIAAATRADEQFAHEAALALYERALTWWPSVADPVGAAGCDHIDVLCAAADAAGQSRRMERACAFSVEALTEALPLDPSACARAYVRAHKHLWGMDRARDANAVVEKCLSRLDELQPSLRAELLVTYADALTFEVRHEDAVAVIEQIRSTDAVLPPDLEAQVQQVMGFAYEGLGDYDLALACADEACRIGRQGLTDVLVRALYNGATIADLAGQREPALARLDEVDAIIAETGAGRRFEVASAALRAEIVTYMGDLEEAHAILDGLDELNLEGVELVLVEDVRTLACTHAGRYEEAAALLAYDQKVLATDTVWMSERAWHAVQIALFTGRSREALDLANDAWADDRIEPQWGGWLALGTVWAAADLFESGELTQAVALENAQRAIDVWERITAFAKVRNGRTAVHDAGLAAELSRITGDNTLESIRAAQRAYVFSPYYVTYFRTREAQALLAQGQRKEATDALATARAAARRHGYAGLDERVTTLARTAQLRLGSEREPDGEGELLSGREVDVLRLLVAGKTNPQIAEELFIGTRTVRTHVSNIFQKLGVATRAEAVTVAHQRGLV